MFLSLKESSAGTFNETYPLTSRKCPSERGMIIPNLSKKRQYVWSHSFVFALEKQPKNLIFQIFLPLRDPLMATFNKTRAPTCRKYVVEQGIAMPN